MFPDLRQSAAAEDKSTRTCLTKSIKVEMSLEHWRNDNGRRKPKYSEKNLS
jgi:predicted nucleic acid-binding Zn ribbon protein